MPSAFLLKATDGKDIGYDKSLVDPYMVVAKGGDRRTFTIARPTGAFYYPDKTGAPKLRAYCTRTYLDLDTFTLAGKTVRNAVDDASLAAAITAARGSMTPSVIVVANGIYTGLYTNFIRAGDQIPGMPNTCIIIAKSIYDSMIANGGISTVMPAKVRVGPSDYPNMPFFQNTSLANVEQWAFGTGADGWRLIGLRFGLATNVAALSRIGRFGNGDSTIQSNASLCPHNLILDRCAVDGNAIVDLKCGWEMHAINQGAIDCYFGQNIHHRSADCQAIRWYNSPGPTAFINSYLCGSTENVLIGGAYSACGLPSDFEFACNFLEKPVTWNAADPSYTGIAWDIKNLLECKALGYANVTGNYLRRSWPKNQAGAGMLFKAESYGNGAVIGYTHDIWAHLNVEEDVGFGFNVAAVANVDPNPTITNICFNGNSFEVGATYYDASTNPLAGILSGTNIGSIHDTMISLGPVNAISQPSAVVDLYYIDSIYDATGYGIKGAGKGEGIPTFNAFAPGADMRGCILVGRPSGSYPPGNYFPATRSIIAFTNAATKDWSLSGTSQGSGAPPPPPPTPVLTSISITPALATVAAGATKQYTATGYDQLGAVMAFTPVWSVVGGAGTISSGGLFTAGTAAGVYSGAIRATSGSIVGQASVTVTAAPPPPPPVLVPSSMEVVTQPGDIGSGANFAPQPEIRIKDQNSGYINDPGLVVTASPNTGAAALTGGLTAVVVGDKASFATLGATTATTGPNTMRFSAPGLPDVISAVFTATKPADPPPPPPPPAPTINSFSATPGSLPNGGGSTLLQWDTDNETAISIDNGVGNVTGLTQVSVSVSLTKTFTLTATNASGTVTATATVTVAAAPPPPSPVPVLTSVVVAPSSAILQVGATQDFDATGYDQFGKVMAFSPVWLVAAGGGTIDADGRFTAGNVAGNFAGTVRAESGGKYATASILVLAPPPDDVPPSPPVPPITRRGICGYYSKRRRLS